MSRKLDQETKSCTAVPSQRSMRLGWITFLVAFVIYETTTTLGTYQKLHRANEMRGGLYTLIDDFGPLIQSILERGQYSVYVPRISTEYPFTAHKMPFVPYFLAEIAHWKNSLLLAMVVKNALWGVLLASAFVQLRKSVPRLGRCVLLPILIYVFTFPKLAIFNTAIAVEEGFLIGLIALLFVYLITWLAPNTESRQMPRAMYVVLPVLNALLFLIKSSMLPLTGAFTIAYCAVSRSRALSALFVFFLATTLFFWGEHNRRCSGSYKLMSSFDGQNFYKGNYPSTLDFYPRESIGVLDCVPLLTTAVSNEWEYDFGCKRQAVNFICSRPLDFLKLSALKFWVMFGEVRCVPMAPEKQGAERVIEWVNRLHMLIFRLVFWGCVVVAIRDLARKKGMDAADNTRRRVIGACFLLVIAMYGAPYIVGWAGQRHVMPMVLPTFAYFLYLLNLRKPDRDLQAAARASSFSASACRLVALSSTA